MTVVRNRRTHELVLRKRKGSLRVQNQELDSMHHCDVPAMAGPVPPEVP